MSHKLCPTPQAAVWELVDTMERTPYKMRLLHRNRTGFTQMICLAERRHRMRESEPAKLLYMAPVARTWVASYNQHSSSAVSRSAQPKSLHHGQHSCHQDSTLLEIRREMSIHEIAIHLLDHKPHLIAAPHIHLLMGLRLTPIHLRIFAMTMTLIAVPITATRDPCPSFDITTQSMGGSATITLMALTRIHLCLSIVPTSRLAMLEPGRPLQHPCLEALKTSAMPTRELRRVCGPSGGPECRRVFTGRLLHRMKSCPSPHRTAPISSVA